MAYSLHLLYPLSTAGGLDRSSYFRVVDMNLCSKSVSSPEIHKHPLLRIGEWSPISPKLGKLSLLGSSFAHRAGPAHWAGI